MTTTTDPDSGVLTPAEMAQRTGVSIEQLRDYCELGEQGDHTQPARLQVFLDHRALIERQIDELRAAIELLDHKIDFYRTAIEGGTP